MRNSIVYIITGFVVIIGLGIFELMYFNKITDEFIYDIERMELEVSFDKKKEKFTKFKEKWENNQRIFSMLIDHQDIHKIETVLVEIDMILKNNFASSQISTNFAILKLYIKDIVDEREFNFKNIL